MVVFIRKQNLTMEDIFKNIAEVDCQNTLQERIDSFKESYNVMINKDFKSFNLDSDEFLIEVLSYVSNIGSAICEEEEYIFDNEGFLTDDCIAVRFIDDLEESCYYRSKQMFKTIVKNKLLKEEKYEFLHAIKNEENS
jgi:hypothetical protein